MSKNKWLQISKKTCFANTLFFIIIITDVEFLMLYLVCSVFFFLLIHSSCSKDMIFMTLLFWPRPLTS